MASKVGTLIKEARTAADLTQEELARRISGLSASDISKAERGEKALTQEQLKKIAKVTGVTQASLLNAAKKTSSGGKASSKTSTKKAATKSSGTSMKLTASEKKLVEAYRDAGSDERKAALRVLQGDCPELLTSLLGGGSSAADGVADFIGDAIGKMLGK